MTEDVCKKLHYQSMMVLKLAKKKIKEYSMIDDGKNLSEDYKRNFVMEQINKIEEVIFSECDNETTNIRVEDRFCDVSKLY